MSTIINDDNERKDLYRSNKKSIFQYMKKIKIPFPIKFLLFLALSMFVMELSQHFDLQYYGKCKNAVVIRVHKHDEPKIHYEYTYGDKPIRGKSETDLNQSYNLKKGDSIKIVYVPDGIFRFSQTYEAYIRGRKREEETILKYPMSFLKLIYRIIKRPGEIVLPEYQDV